MGITLDDLESLTPGEFNAAHEAWITLEESRYRAGWEQSRYVAYHSIAPHAKRGFKITDLGKFEWETTRAEDVKVATLKDFENMKKRYGD